MTQSSNLKNEWRLMKTNILYPLTSIISCSWFMMSFSATSLSSNHNQVIIAPLSLFLEASLPKDLFALSFKGPVSAIWSEAMVEGGRGLTFQDLWYVLKE